MHGHLQNHKLTVRYIFLNSTQLLIEKNLVVFCLIKHYFYLLHRYRLFHIKINWTIGRSGKSVLLLNEMPQDKASSEE